MVVSRLDGLSEAAARQVVAAAQALDVGGPDEAAARLGPALASNPTHPEVQRVLAGIQNLRGDHLGAFRAMERALEQRPQDALYYNTLGTILGDTGDYDGAISALRQACALQPDLAIAWFNLGVMLTRCVRHKQATAALQRAIALDPQYMPARVLLGDTLRGEGHTREAAIEYRKVIAEQPWTGMAWWGLADLKTVRFTAEDVKQLRQVMQDPRAEDSDLIAMGFALAKALDDASRYADSMAALAQANAIARRRKIWNAQTFTDGISGILEAFTPPPDGAPNSDLGRGVIFIVSLPRSGSTLVEQILASHSAVEGSGELPDVLLTLGDESHRRGKPYPHWVTEMQATDWQRLGEDYLQRTARWFERRQFFTDKLPANWYHVGAIRAMLPAAKIVVCRRDPLETCFSCYRQYFANNEYSRTFEDLAAHWRNFDRSIRHWRALHPAHVHELIHEDLIADPEAKVRALLEFCGLPFEEACLRFHLNKREVRSPSAMQVRQPLRGDTARAPRYGALLDPLRKALGMPPFAGEALPPATRSEQEWLEQTRASILRGDSATAESLLSIALMEHPRSFELRRVQAGIYRQTHRDAQAEPLLRELLAERPNEAGTAFTLSRMLVDQGRTCAAAMVIRTCFENGRHDAELAIKAVELLDDCNRKRDAAVIAERAIADHPQDPRLHAYAGMLQLQLGAFEQAREHYLLALEHGSQACEWHVPHGLASAQRYQDSDHPDFARFRECLQRDGLSDKARSTLLFALGKAHEDIRDYAKAADYFRQANALAHALNPWSRRDWRRAVEARLDAKPITHPLDSSGDWAPVFIVGMPRSGTTLVAELLSQHPQVCNRGELPWIARLAQQPELAIAPDRTMLEHAAAIYAAQTRQDDATGARWFIDKQTLNFRYIDLILAMFPNAKIIHCQRGTRDIALSLWTQSFVEDVQGYAYDFADIAVVMRDCERLMAHWRKRYPESIRAVHYEELVANPQSVIAELGEWLTLPEVDAPVAEKGNSSASISTASLWQARQPVYTRSVQRWRAYADYIPELLKFAEYE